MEEKKSAELSGKKTTAKTKNTKKPLFQQTPRTDIHGNGRQERITGNRNTTNGHAI